VKKTKKAPAKKAKAKKATPAQARLIAHGLLLTKVDRLKKQLKTARENLKYRVAQRDEALREAWHERSVIEELKASHSDSINLIQQLADAERAKLQKLQNEISYYRDAIEELAAFFRDPDNHDGDEEGEPGDFDPNGMFSDRPRPANAKVWYLALADELIDDLRMGPTVEYARPYAEVEAERLKRLPELLQPSKGPKTGLNDSDDDDSDDDDSDDDSDDYGEDSQAPATTPAESTPVPIDVPGTP
jgi:hypothetical protein